MEEKVGIRAYITETEGIDGDVKLSLEDFYVEEVAKLKLDNEGRFTIIRVKKVDWDTMNFVRTLANALRISQKRIHYAGTKDKKAVTVQHFAISGLSEEKMERLRNLKIKDAEIEVLGKSNRDIKLGDLIGNLFRVVVRNAKDGERIERIRRELEEKGTPNFFGLQRFGSIRFITHEVGLHILKRDYETAFWVYVAKPFEGENEEVRKVREILWETRDAKLGLRELPKYLRYERNLLQKLREGKSEKEALLSLPLNLKMMFIHAYQSYVFNRVLSARIEEFGNLKDIEVGDWADFVEFENGHYRFAEEVVKVREHNVRRVRFLVEKRRASLALPLPGYETPLGDDWISQKVKEVLEEDGVSLEDFKHEYKEFSSKGSFRVADMLIEHTGLKVDVNDAVRFEFFLPKGFYATVFLREFVKRPLA